MVADHLELGVADDQFYAAAEGDVDAVRVGYTADDCDAFAVDGAPLDSLFSTAYLASVARVVPADADVRVRFGDGQPVEFAFDLAGGSVRYVVAPRIQQRGTGRTPPESVGSSAAVAQSSCPQAQLPMQ